MTLKRKMEVLRRRKAHLEKRIADNPTIDLSYDKAEVSALAWAIGKLEEILENEGVEA